MRSLINNAPFECSTDIQHLIQVIPSLNVEKLIADNVLKLWKDKSTVIAGGNTY
jgi:hypothetical protein